VNKFSCLIIINLEKQNKISREIYLQIIFYTEFNTLKSKQIMERGGSGTGSGGNGGTQHLTEFLGGIVGFWLLFKSYDEEINGKVEIYAVLICF
jgi:hypothetical protein